MQPSIKIDGTDVCQLFLKKSSKDVNVKTVTSSVNSKQEAFTVSHLGSFVEMHLTHQCIMEVIQIRGKDLGLS